jgi:hypothetical protein
VTAGTCQLALAAGAEIPELGVAVGTAHDAEATGAAIVTEASTTAAATAHDAIPTGALTD